MLLSIPYADICNKERLIVEDTTIDLAVDTYSYTLSSYILSPKLIRLNDTNKTLLDEVGMDEMPLTQRLGGLPTKWTVNLVNAFRVLLIDTLPDLAYASDSTYRLNVNYWKKIFYYTGTAENSFSDLDFTTSTYISALASAGASGFQNPTEWDSVIIYGALMKLIPEYAELYRDSYESALKATPNLSYRTFKGAFGVPVETNVRTSNQ